MIRFYNDNLVPPELCRLLYTLVPKQHHLPMRFHNRRRKDVHGERGRYPRGSVGTNGCWTEPSHIDINLNPIFGVSQYRHYTSTCVPSSFVWRDLLEVCLHEFGHVATWDTVLHMNHYEYIAEYGRGRVYKATEQLADEWKERCLERILAWDPRLAQPEVITGYLGARLIEHREFGKKRMWGRYYWAWVKDVRCLKTGGQLTAGNVLRELGIYPYRYTNAYEVLKRASVGLGIDYVDGAGRRHKLYTWGDVPLVEERLERATLRERPRHRVARENSDRAAPPDESRQISSFDIATATQDVKPTTRLRHHNDATVPRTVHELLDQEDGRVAGDPPRDAQPSRRPSREHPTRDDSSRSKRRR